VKARPVKKLDPDAPLSENAARIVSVRLDELLSLAPKALKPKRHKAQHDMRIAAKRLRYVLEVAGFCFGRPADIGRRRAREAQDILGEIHDCDVMLPRVLEHLERMRDDDAAEVSARAGASPDLDPRIASEAPHRTSYRGLEVLAVYAQARRQLLFRRFQRFWERQEEQGTWLRLQRAVDKVLDESRERRRAERQAVRVREARDAAERAGIRPVFGAASDRPELRQ
jgi:hypothetical protein